MANYGMPIASIAPMEASGGRPRKESLIDTEPYAKSATVPTSLFLFSNFSAFATATVGVTLVKQRGRDTNLTGSGQGLPAYTVFHWFEWRMQLLAMGIDLTSSNASVAKDVSAQFWRLLQVMACAYSFQQSVLIQLPATEIPAGVGPAYVSHTHTDAAIYGPNCTPDRRGKNVTIQGAPVKIVALQSFSIEQRVPDGNFAPTVDIFSRHVLEGVFTKALVA